MIANGSIGSYNPSLGRRSTVVELAVMEEGSRRGRKGRAGTGVGNDAPVERGEVLAGMSLKDEWATRGDSTGGRPQRLWGGAEWVDWRPRSDERFDPCLFTGTVGHKTEQERERETAERLLAERQSDQGDEGEKGG